MYGCQVVLLEPIWVQQDQPPAQEWPLRRPAGTTEFQLCLPAKHLTQDYTCTACVQGLSGSLVTRNPLDLTRRFSIGSRRRQFLESGVFSSDDGRCSGYQPSCNSPALRMCPAGVLNGHRAPRCKENGHTCAEHMPWNGLQSRSRGAGEFRFPVAGGVGLRQYRVVRWFLLPEAELRRRLVTR